MNVNLDNSTIQYFDEDGKSMEVVAIEEQYFKTYIPIIFSAVKVSNESVILDEALVGSIFERSLLYRDTEGTSISLINLDQNNKLIQIKNEENEESDFEILLKKSNNTISAECKLMTNDNDDNESSPSRITLSIDRVNFVEL
tara:strand:+ start:14534 stop:14959 length:426 start_codon:yes stop_codon:yes gene_type:complete